LAIGQRDSLFTVLKGIYSYHMCIIFGLEVLDLSIIKNLIHLQWISIKLWKSSDLRFQKSKVP
jgi:hypothetical protein